MIGIFDSGRGAHNAAHYLERMLPSVPRFTLTDKRHAPFGTKSREELIPILKGGLYRLERRGATVKLLACCTMCTVLPYLDPDAARGVFTVIEPTARAAAAVTRSGKIAVIATERTVSEGAFSRELLALCPEVAVSEIPAPTLVGIAERGGPVSREESEEILKIARLVRESRADTLVLGCTHFSSLKKQIRSALPDISLVDSAREGAAALASYIKLKENEKWQNTEEDELTRR